MNQFLKRTTLFLLPILLIVVALETYLKTAESTYLLKSTYFRTKEYQTLVLGSSHNQNAINPAFMPGACNVAMGSQDLRMDLELLKKAIQLNHRPNCVILEMSYHRFRENPKKYWRNGIYEYFYDVDLSEGINFSKYLLISSNLKFFRNYFGELVSSRKHVYKYNQFGFDDNDFDGPFSQMGYDESKIANTAKGRLRVDSWAAPDTATTQRAVNYLKEINLICTRNKIRLVLVAPPVYDTYYTQFKDLNLSIREQSVDILKRDNPALQWLNFERSPSFKVNHFKNDDHLNAAGAEIFTRMLNDSLQSFNRNGL